jgi:hypothetical protein
LIFQYHLKEFQNERLLADYITRSFLLGLIFSLAKLYKKFQKTLNKTGIMNEINTCSGFGQGFEIRYKNC